MENNLLSEKLVYTGESQTETHLHLTTYNTEEVQKMSATDFESLTGFIHNEQTNWLQVHGLSNTETIRKVCAHFEIDFLTLQDILNADHPTKIDEHEEYIVVITKLFLPVSKPTEELLAFNQQQICLILGRNFVLTFLEDETDFFDKVTIALHNNILKIRDRHTDYLLSVLLNSVMGSYTSLVTSIDDALENLEEELLSITAEKDIGAQIQLLRRQYMTIKKSILPLKEQYLKLLRAENQLIHKTNRAFFNDVNDHLQFVVQTIEICRETLSSLVDLYISNNDLRMNAIMKRLTVVSTIFIPLTFLVGVWGMNFKLMPELEWEYGYFVAWSIMIILGVIIAYYFKKKRY